VTVGHLYHVPLAILEVFGRWGRDEAIGMSACYDIFAIDAEYLVTGSRNVQVWQLFKFYLLNLTDGCGVMVRNSLALYGRREQEQQTDMPESGHHRS
jgi:hypothetical protein